MNYSVMKIVSAPQKKIKSNTTQYIYVTYIPLDELLVCHRCILFVIHFCTVQSTI